MFPLLTPDLKEGNTWLAFHLLFIFFSSRFFGSLGFFVLETLTAKQFDLQI